MGNSYLAGVDPLAGETIVVSPHFGGGCRMSLSGCFLEVQDPTSIFAKFFGAGCGIGLSL
jgi:hypothetical protein